MQKDNKVVEPMSTKQTTILVHLQPTRKLLYVWKYAVNKVFKCVGKETFGNYPAKREYDSMALVVAATSTAAKQAIRIMGFVARKNNNTLLPITSHKIV